MSLADWKRAAKEEIDGLFEYDITDKNAMVLSSWITIYNYGDVGGNDSEDRVPSSKIDEEMQEYLDCFVEYVKQKGLEQTTGAPTHGEYAENALKDMLHVNEKIAEMLYNSADRKERQFIADSYRRIAGGMP